MRAATTIGICLFWGAALVLRAHADPPTTGEPVVLQSGTHEVHIRPSTAWTPSISKIDGVVVGRDNGFWGTVFLPSSGNWIGTGHTEGGVEIVTNAVLTIDGVVQGEPVPGQTYSGDVLTFTKHSRLAGLNLESVVQVSSNGFHEEAHLTVHSNQFVQLLYAFMHPFYTNTTLYMAGDGSTTYAGELQSDGNNELQQAVKWLALYSPRDERGVFLSYPELYPGAGDKNKIWDKDNYHKHYFQAMAWETLEVGDKRDWEIDVQHFTAPPSQWQEEVWELVYRDSPVSLSNGTLNVKRGWLIDSSTPHM